MGKIETQEPMTPPTNPPTPRRYWAVTDAEGVRVNGITGEPMVFSDADTAQFVAGFGAITEVAIIPTATHARLLAIEAAARNAMENSWHIDTPHPDCVCHDWRGCTVFDDKDAQELKEALTPAAPGDKGE